jgi:hypothetical protein
MDIDDQEPPRAPSEPVLRSHTTLRTLLLVTAVAALVLGISLWLPYRPVTLLVASCAASFIGGLFGMSLWAGFTIGLIAAVAGDAYSIATLKKSGMPLVTAIKYALQDEIWIFGLLWLTASWWGLYLRYAWSNPVWPPAREDNSGVTRRRTTLRERVIARCADAPVGFFVISLLANVLVFIVAVQFI